MSWQAIAALSEPDLERRLFGVTHDELNLPRLGEFGWPQVEEFEVAIRANIQAGARIAPDRP